MTRSLWRLLAAPLLMAFVMLAPSPAMAQSYGPTITCTVNVANNGTTTVTCTGFVPGETVNITLGGVVVGTGVADANGTVVIVVKNPNGGSLAGQTLVATGALSGRSGTIKLTAGPTVVCTVNIPVTVDGGAFTITCTGFEPGETVTFVIDSVPVVLGTAVADSTGKVVLATTAPNAESLGAHNLTATGGTSGRIGLTSITIVAPTLASAPGGTAFTGANALLTSAAGAGIIGAGGLLVLLSRKRRRRGAAA